MAFVAVAGVTLSWAAWRIAASAAAAAARVGGRLGRELTKAVAAANLAFLSNPPYFLWNSCWKKKEMIGNNVRQAKDSFIAQDRNVDFVGRQVESTFSQGHCDLTSGTILNK